MKPLLRVPVLHRASQPFALRVLFILALIPALARGQAEPPSTRELAELSLEQLANLQITSVSKRPERLADAPASVFIITGEDIRRSGATTLPQALRLAPNLEVARRDASQYSISARGFASSSSNKLLVLIDGRAVYTPLFSGVFWDAQDVMLEDVDRIEVISGPGATVWGTNAVVGVINVITRGAGDTRGGLAAAGGGNRDRGGAVRYGTRLGESGAIRFYAKYMDQDETERADGVPVRDAWHNAQVGFRSDWESSVGSLTLQGDAYRALSEQAVPGLRRAEGANLLTRFTHLLADGSRLRIQAYYDHTDREQPGTFGETLDIIDLEAQHGLAAIGSHSLTWGGGYRFARDRVRNSAVLAFLPTERDLRWWNLFVQDEIALRRDLDLTAGVRIEDNVYTGVEALPSLRLAWRLADNKLLWGSLSRAVRSPSRVDRELFAPAQPPFFLAGGPDFRSEVSRVAEVGYRAQASSTVSYSITAFHHIYDHIRSVEAVPGDGLMIANGIEGTASGVEAWGTWQAAANWRLSAGVVALRQRLRLAAESRATGGVATEGNDPSSQWKLRSAFDLAPGHELDIFVRRIGALPDPSVPAYVAADVRYGWRIARRLELSIVGRNLFDRRHPEFGSAATRSEIERSAYVKLVWTF